MYHPTHSDFLIHWTGKDIDDEFDNQWDSNHSSRTDEAVTEKYLERLKNTLRHGLWLTKKEEDKTVIVNGSPIEIPWIARTCFTELRLSQARAHAKKFGRLGIGFKRLFLFDRFGSPVSYYFPTRKNWFFYPHITQKNGGKLNNFASCFLKTMCEPSKGDGTWQYTFFDESEWRIIYSEEVKECLFNNDLENVNSFFVDPKDSRNTEEFKFYNSLKTKMKPEYFLPLDAWFSMIIYPSLSVKNAAQNDKEIKKLINDIKNKPTPGCPSVESTNYPIEVNLDACRNF